MPNWNSNAFITTNPKIIKKLRTITDEDGQCNNLLGAFIPMPPQLQAIKTGSTIIDGQNVRKWIENRDGQRMILDSTTAAELVQRYGADNWYDWAIANWGTKWDAEGTVEFGVGVAMVHFDTAWAPPLAWLAKVVAAHPKGETALHYSEPGIGFFGSVKYLDGDKIEAWGSNEFMSQPDYWADETDFEDMMTQQARNHTQLHGL